MYALKQISAFKPELASRRSPPTAGAGRHGIFRRTQVLMSRVYCPGSIRAVISSEDKAVESVRANKEVSKTLFSSSNDKGGGIDVRAVITIRKKMKEKITEKIEAQWESFIKGIGQGILIQLISEEVDSG